jgi:hypothetical protein
MDTSGHQQDVRGRNQNPILWIYDTRRDRPLAPLLPVVDEGWQQFEAALQTMRVQELLEPGRSAGYEDGCLRMGLLSDLVDHYHNDHEADAESLLNQL